MRGHLPDVLPGEEALVLRGRKDGAPRGRGVAAHEGEDAPDPVSFGLAGSRVEADTLRAHVEAHVVAVAHEHDGDEEQRDHHAGDDCVHEEGQEDGLTGNEEPHDDQEYLHDQHGEDDDHTQVAQHETAGQQRDRVFPRGCVAARVAIGAGAARVGAFLCSFRRCPCVLCVHPSPFLGRSLEVDHHTAEGMARSINCRCRPHQSRRSRWTHARLCGRYEYVVRLSRRVACLRTYVRIYSRHVGASFSRASAGVFTRAAGRFISVPCCFAQGFRRGWVCFLSGSVWREPAYRSSPRHRSSRPRRLLRQRGGESRFFPAWQAGHRGCG